MDNESVSKDIIKEMFQILQEMSNLLDTGLDSKTLMYCINLCQKGVSAEKLAKVILEADKDRNENRHLK